MERVLSKGDGQASVELAARYVKVRREKADGYPDRYPVPDAKASWDVPMPEYAPPYFVSPKVLAQDDTRHEGGWADPEDHRQVTRSERAYRKDQEGRPLNPMGRTGLAGRGFLGRWGVNPAVDPMVMWWDGAKLRTVVIQRQQRLSTQQGISRPWAIPGGMVDPGETATQALSRELKEETGITQDMSPAAGAREVFCGPVDDPRSTDHAWIESTAAYVLLSSEGGVDMERQMTAGDDARAVKAAPVDAALLRNMYASHGGFLRLALSDISQRMDVAPAIRDAARRVLEEK